MIISVPFAEHEDSPIESGDRGTSLDFTRIFVTNFDQRFTFLTELFTGGVLGLPMQYSPQFPSLLASKFSIERKVNKVEGPNHIWNPAVQGITHKTVAFITVNYEPLTIADLPLPNGTWITYTRQSAIEYIGHPGRKMIWESSGESLPQDVQSVTPVPVTRHEVTWHQVKNVPWNAIRYAKGLVHSGTFNIPATNDSVPDGHLLFSEETTRLTLGFDGSTTTEITLAFLEKQQKAFTGGNTFGWNYQWNPVEQQYDRPVTDTGQYQFPSGNLLSIFS